MPIIPNTLPDIPRLFNNRRGVLPLPLSQDQFSFDSFGLASFFGGENALAGMASVALIPGRRWLGWYNTPGSLEIAKQYARLAKLKISEALFPDGERDPARLFKLDGRMGPQFIAAHTGVTLEHTGHIASLIARRAEAANLTQEMQEKARRGHRVTIVNLSSATLHLDESSLLLPMKAKTLWSLAPMSVSVGACILCALVEDWFCFASIAVGTVAHGFACVIIGSGKLTFTAPRADEKPPPGDGVLKDGRDMIVLVGPEGGVNVITHGRFNLKYGLETLHERQDHGANGQKATYLKPRTDQHEGPNLAPHMGPPTPVSTQPPSPSSSQSPSPPKSEPPPHQEKRSIAPKLTIWHFLLPYCIWISALLLMVQPLIQIFLIPLGTLFGQFMFITTILASWAYNIYLSYNVDHDDIQTKIIFNMLGVEDARVGKLKYGLSSWTSAIVFTCLFLASVRQLDDPHPLLDAMVKNDTALWKQWKKMVAGKLMDLKYVREAEGRMFSEAELTAGKRELEIVLGNLQEVNRGQVGDSHQQGLDIYTSDAEEAWLTWCQYVALGRKDEAAM